jgi:NADH dehydrogenase
MTDTTAQSGGTVPHIVIVGGGFGGLHAARRLGNAPVRVTLVDRRNYHLFQPLLYQVATGGLSPGDIASPLRGVLSPYKNIRVLLAEAVDLDPAQRLLIVRNGQLHYDVLVCAAGASHHYFGHDEWAAEAPGLKSVEDALEIRRRILLAFEAAEWEPDPEHRRAWMTFVIVGGGPTGVELAGALGELARGTLPRDFRHIDTRQTRILLIEGMERVLPTYPPDLSAKAAAALARLGVTVQTRSLVTDIQGDIVTVRQGEQTTQVRAKTVLWTAAVRASPLGHLLAERTGCALDRAGRVLVQPDLTIPGHPEIFVIGDLAAFLHQDGRPLPGVAPVAMQQGRYVAELIRARLQGRSLPPFRYRDPGSLAVIGRNAAVADFGRLHLSGFPAWLIWVFVHIANLIEHDDRLLVMIQWAWHYFTRKRGARLITGSLPFPLPAPQETPAGTASVNTSRE